MACDEPPALQIPGIYQDQQGCYYRALTWGMGPDSQMWVVCQPMFASPDPLRIVDPEDFRGDQLHIPCLSYVGKRLPLAASPKNPSGYWSHRGKVVLILARTRVPDSLPEWMGHYASWPVLTFPNAHIRFTADGLALSAASEEDFLFPLDALRSASGEKGSLWTNPLYPE